MNYKEAMEAFGKKNLEDIEKIFDLIPHRQATVLLLRYGLPKKRLSLKEIGKIFKVTPERIRQVEAIAFRKLMHPSRRKIFDLYE